MTAVGNVAMHGTNDEVFPSNKPVQLASYEVVNLIVQTKGLSMLYQCLKFYANIIECSHEILFENPIRQVQSSFVMNWTSVSHPANSLSVNKDVAWYSPVRSGQFWGDSIWLQYDFLTIMRVTKVSLFQPDLFRVPTRLRFDYSNSGSTFNKLDTSE